MTGKQVAFDLVEGEKRKEMGIKAAALARRSFVLQVARNTASAIATYQGFVTADDVFQSMAAAGYDPAILGNAAGAVFRGGEFEFTGQWEKSSRVSNHARVNRVWRLKT